MKKKQLIDELSDDTEILLMEQIKLFSVRERRLMQAINKYRNSAEPVALSFTQRGERKKNF